VPDRSAVASEQVASTTVADSAGHLAGVSIRSLDVNDPLLRGIFVLDQGKLPSSGAEAALSRRLLMDLGAEVGQVIHLGARDSELTYRVTGVVTQASNTSARVAVVQGLEPWLASSTGAQTRLYVKGEVPERLPAGVDVQTREAATGAGPVTGDVATVIAVVGLLTLETVLLCTAAFMVGAKRQERELAIFAATSGATRSDLTRVVLAGGVLLGACGATVGILLGLVAVVLGQPLIQRLTAHLVSGVEIDGRLLLIAWTLGLLTSVLAATSPAWRMRRMLPLTSLRAASQPPGPVSLGRLQVCAVAVCLLVLVVGFVTESIVATALGGGGSLIMVSVLAPVALTQFESVSARVPLTIRLSLRDLARHPARGGPAVAAISVALAGAIIMSSVWATDMANQRAAYLPTLYDRHVLLRSDFGAAVPRQLVLQVRESLPTKLDAPLIQVGVLPIQDREGNISPSAAAGELTYSISSVRGPATGIAEIYVGDRSLVAMLGASSATDSFERGDVVSSNAALISDGATLITRVDATGGMTSFRHSATTFIPLGDEADAEPKALLSFREVNRLDLPTTETGWLFELEKSPTPREREAAERAVADTGGAGLSLVFETGYKAYANRYITVLLAAALVLAAGVIAISTALSSADSRPDVATLAAIGADRRLRRRLAVAQAMVLTALGCTSALCLGSVIGIAAARAKFGVAEFTLPWLQFGGAFIVLIALAWGVGSLTSLGHMPTTRRSR
jgi:putative ABC transport system permease protein